MRNSRFAFWHLWILLVATASEALTPLEAAPGSRFAYSNLGYIRVGSMLEHVTGRTWEELICDRVFDPLGLKTAGLGPQAHLGRVDAPLGHSIVDGRPRAFLSGPNGDNPSVLGPAGVAHMSVLDFGSWAGWSLGGFLSLRAASGEPRLAACIADPGLMSLRAPFQKILSGLPAEALAHPREVDKALSAPGTLVRFLARDGAGDHCAMMGRSLFHQRMFDWLEETWATH